MHLSAGIGTGKAPMDTAMVRIALSGQRHNVLPQVIEALDAFGQTAPLENADLNLGHIEPTAMLRRIMHLQSLLDKTIRPLLVSGEISSKLLVIGQFA